MTTISEPGSMVGDPGARPAKLPAKLPAERRAELRRAMVTMGAALATFGTSLALRGLTGSGAGISVLGVV
ncbi:hypothetical protein, partial [Frankia tisae]|uniref:hypothetical protein n=1 Tax=Frankia tisae TaxID=2950104 RepID=UPI0021C02301